MKMRILKKLISVILALLMLASCAPLANKGSGSSNIANGEEKKPSISSAASIETNSEIVSSSLENEEEGEKEEPNTSKQPSSDKEETSSSNKKPTKLPQSTKFNIPEDNPLPVTIKRSDAAAPTRISFSKNTQGVKIPFEQNTVISSNANDEWNSHIAIIKTAEEMQNICLKDSYEQSSEKNYNDLYPEDFFKDNAIIALFFTLGGSTHSLTIENVTRQSGRMYIDPDYKKNSGYSLAVIKYYRVFVSIPKEELEKVSDIVVYQE